MKKKKHAKFKKGSLILAAQFIASLLIMFTSLKIAFLPWFYQLLLAVLLILLLGLVHKIIYPKKKEKRKAFRQLTGIILSLVLSFFLVISSSYLNVANAALSGMAKSDPTANYRTYVIDGSYNSIGKLQGQTVGLLTLGDEAEHTKAKQIIKNKLHCETEDYDTVLDMLSSLRRGEIQAVFINDAYKTVCANNYTGWNRNAYCVDKISFTYDEEDTPSTNKNISKNAFTVLISGVDSRKSVTETCRSDVNMLVTIQPETHQILMTSIPRDYYVSLNNAQGHKDKLCHAALFGTYTLQKTLINTLDINIDFYTRVSFTSLTKIVDLIGGVKIYSDKTFVPWTDRGITIKKGWQTMNGRYALAFSRERKTYTNGDSHRAANQQAVLKAIIEKMSSSPLLIKKYPEIMKALSTSIQTNMSSDQMKQLLRLEIASHPSWDIMNTVLEGNSKRMLGGYLMPHTSLYYMIPDENSIDEHRQYIQNMINGQKISVN
ncbi:hypothetical protein IV49_GL001655 [Kandleria vitulina DSM 20405]|uniref:Cell envelope-related transcriptional attenuator domain-containing protein n=1 Tax=Kandleria vitulina DSM 20405 TaxID=1410657 RepID=A0A0R2HLY5_9FIRM|nr:LCP family protein [Kandleria vitulina]KRN50839.1 hypothetical protein IV49_GL001655 [Kandleria vitulina DSM 20405]